MAQKLPAGYTPLSSSESAFLKSVAASQKEPVYHYLWTKENQFRDADSALKSPLLALSHTSDVNKIPVQQIIDARTSLRLRAELVQQAAALLRESSAERQKDPFRETTKLQQELARLEDFHRRIIERFLVGRRDYFGPLQCHPFQEVEALVHEDRDVFIIVKFMDEAPHIEATLNSLLCQTGISLARVVIILVDNNSRDGSEQIVRNLIERNPTEARIIYTNQPVPGGGNTARFGVDRTIATIHQMCVLDGNWGRLQWSFIGVSDGDTVYHPCLVSEAVRILTDNPEVDGVMPFLTYKATAALRLFRNHVPSVPPMLSCSSESDITVLPIDLSDLRAYNLLPRRARKLLSEDAMEVQVRDRDGSYRVAMVNKDDHSRKYGMLADHSGNRAFLFADRTLVLEKAPVSGIDAALVFLENGLVREDEKWRWHSIIGHDLVLWWAFQAMGLPVEMVYPDTSDALKMFRAWSFAIGGQHQLSQPAVPIVTGTDYQSGRVLQVIGNTIRLGPAYAYAETETDRLTKMIRNFARQQGVFYGEVRSPNVERASGHYLHLKRVQRQIELEIRDYPDEFFRDVVFPERILFLLRWILQNALRFFAHHETDAQEIVYDRVVSILFREEAAQVRREWFNDKTLYAIRQAEFSQKQDLAERIAESIILSNYASLMGFYTIALRSFLDDNDLDTLSYMWLLDGLAQSRSALAEKRRHVHPSEVWQGRDLVIDFERGQVVGINASDADSALQQ